MGHGARARSPSDQGRFQHGAPRRGCAQRQAKLEIWRHDVNAKGGLLGRPVELVFDQSNPNNVPGIYTKLISVDKVDLLIGRYATNMI